MIKWLCRTVRLHKSSLHKLSGKLLLAILLVASSSGLVAPSLPEAYGHGGKTTNLTVQQHERQLNVTGPQRTILILVEFHDTAHTKSAGDIDETMLLVDEYWRKISYGKISVVWSIAGWYLLNRTLEYYGMDTGEEENDANATQLLRDSTMAADNDVNYRDFNHVAIVHSGMDQTISNRTGDLWPHHYVGLNISTNDGTRIDQAFYVSEFGGLGVYVHEFAHDLGLPDLYPRDKTKTHLVGSWSLMDTGNWLGDPRQSSPSGLEAWSLAKLGWVSTVEVNPTAEGTVMTLYPLERDFSTRVLKISISEGTYYLIELRMKTGVDRAQPFSAVLISFINETAWTAYHEGYGVVNITDTIPTDLQRYTYQDERRRVFIQMLSCNATSCEIAIASRAILAHHNIPSTIWALFPTEIVVRFTDTSRTAIPNLRVTVHIDESIQYVETDSLGEARFNLFFIIPSEHMIHVETSGIMLNEVAVTVRSDATWVMVLALVIMLIYFLGRAIRRRNNSSFFDEPKESENLQHYARCQKVLNNVAILYTVKVHFQLGPDLRKQISAEPHSNGKSPTIFKADTFGDLFYSS